MTNAIRTAAAKTSEFDRITARSSRQAMNSLGRRLAEKAARLYGRDATFEEVEMGIKAAERVCYFG